MKTSRQLFRTIFVTLLLLAALHLFVWDVVTVMPESRSAVFCPGDRLLLVRPAYGIRLPLSDLWGLHRIGHRRAEKGDWVVFNSPADTGVALSHRRTMIERCTAVPGDTVWFTWSHRQVKRSTPCSTLYPFVIPGEGIRIDVTPWNARLLCLTLNLHEGKKATLKNDTTLLLNGKEVQQVSFAQNYYWFSSDSEENLYDSRYFGFVPQSHLQGRACLILFSKDPKAGFFSGFRRERTLYPLSKQPSLYSFS